MPAKTNSLAHSYFLGNFLSNQIHKLSSCIALVETTFPLQVSLETSLKNIFHYVEQQSEILPLMASSLNQESLITAGDTDKHLGIYGRLC